MALVKFGGGIIQASGSIAGVVHARNRFGNYIRPRTKPVNPHSERQESRRAIVSHLAEYWHDDMLAAARELWEVYAAAITMKNRLGEDITLTGFNHFIRTNSLQLMLTEAIISVAPTTLALMEKDETAAISAEDVAGQTLTFTFDATGWGMDDDDKYWMVLSMGQPQLGSRMFFNGPWRYTSAVGTVAGALGTITAAAAFPFAVGQKVWCKARMISKSGRTSQDWILAPRVIEADA